MKRIYALILALLTVFGMASAHAMNAGEDTSENTGGGVPTRLTMTYYPTSYYSGSVYYSNLRELQITGNQRLDIINVALSQVGYHEGNKVSQLDGSNQNGNQNYTEYGYWFGKQVVGQDSGFYYEWCAIFTAWCARQSRVPVNVINNASYAHAGSNPYYFNTVTYHARGTYTPKSGDLIFYDWAYNDKKWDHVGIVLYVYGGKLYAVEGNASEQVLIREISAYDNEIQGFGVPKYTSANANAIDPSSYPVPTRTLEYGDTGNDVSWLQASLLRLGFPCPIDGRFGANTQRQVKALQKYLGMSQTGIVGPNTREAIKTRIPNGHLQFTDPSYYPFPTKTLQRGSRGMEVRWVQAALKKMGASIVIDGDFGPATETKVKWAQGKLGISQTGVVDANTAKKMRTAIGGSSGGGSSGGGSGSTPSIPYPVPTRNLKYGMSGDDVKWLQTVLRRYGCSVSATGYFGEVTLSCVKRFQRDHGLTQDGIVGPATRGKLIAFLNGSGSGSGSGSTPSIPYPVPTRTLKVGCTGDDVKWLQAALKQLGFTITVDGIFGNGTKGTVIQFQRYNGLTQDGIVGPATRTALKNAVH